MLYLLFLSLMPSGSEVSVPDTAAGRRLSEFIRVFDSGSQSQMRKFAQEAMEPPPRDAGFVDDFVDEQRVSFAQTAGYVVRKTERSNPTSVEALVSSKLTGAWYELSVYVDAKPPAYLEPVSPYKIVGLGLMDRSVPPAFQEKTRLNDRQVGQRLRVILDGLAARGQFSGSVVLAKNGKVLFGKAYGLASRSWNVKNKVDTKFNLASITKMFTAVSVAQLVQAGKLRFHETVGEVLPDLPNKELSRVTLAQLLSHTSGIVGSREQISKYPSSPKLRTVADLVKTFQDAPLSFPPGQQFDYSNAGYELLGLIIEKASGKSYFAYERQHIFRPAGMHDTDFYELDTDPPNLATGFEDGPHGTRLDNIFDLGVIGFPDGGAYSTGPDMARFATALTSGRLVNGDILAKMWTGVTENPEKQTEYGYGAELFEVNGYKVVSHGGGWNGVTNAFAFLPELGYSVTVLSNIDDDPNLVSSKVLEWLTQGRGPLTRRSEAAPKIAAGLKVSAMTLSVGKSVTLSVNVVNTGGSAHATIVDLEVKDSAGAKSFQRFVMGQKLLGNRERLYRFQWVPSKPGTYQVDVAVFKTGWQGPYVSLKSLLNLEVK